MGKVIVEGDSKLNNQGSKMTVVKKYRENNMEMVDVQFETGFNVNHVYISNYIAGKVKDYYYPYVLGKGYFGVGEFKARIKDQYTKPYSIWRAMLDRCYNEKFHAKNRTYIGCSVCDEWLNYQTFARWFTDNYYELSNEKVGLDKDIIYRHNKIYSPNNCVFVPQSINNVVEQSNNSRGNCPVGVYYSKKGKCYIAQITVKNTNITIGRFNNMYDAFYSYKKVKEEHIKQIAEQYKDKIPKKLYDALYKWEVNIDD